MIKLISKGDLDNGGHEQIWSLTLFHVEHPTTFFHVCRNANESDVDSEMRNERSQVVVSSVGKYISLEETNGLKKDQLELEAIDRLTKMYEHMSINRFDIKKNCSMILSMESIIKRIARPGNQYIYFKILIQLAKEQIEYEKSIDRI